MTTQQREAFQVWAADKGLNLSSFGGIKYNSGTTQIVWEAWQAAQQAQGEAATEQQLIDAQRSQGAGIHPQPAQQVPEGWKIERHPEGISVYLPNSRGGIHLTDGPHNSIAHVVLRELCAALLTHPQPAQQVQGEVEPVAFWDERSLADIGNELHNLATAMHYTGREDDADEISKVAIELWEWEKSHPQTDQNALSGLIQIAHWHENDGVVFEDGSDGADFLEHGQEFFIKISSFNSAMIAALKSDVRITKDAYDGAREDLQIWKKRALEAEADLLREREAFTGNPVAPNRLKKVSQWTDRDTDRLVNRLTHTACIYKDRAQLRQLIAGAIRPVAALLTPTQEQ